MPLGKATTGTERPPSRSSRAAGSSRRKLRMKAASLGIGVARLRFGSSDPPWSTANLLFRNVRVTACAWGLQLEVIMKSRTVRLADAHVPSSIVVVPGQYNG